LLPPRSPVPAVIEKDTGKEVSPAIPGGDLAEQQASFDKVIADMGVKDFQSLTYTIVPKEQRVKVTKENSVICLHILEGQNGGVGGRFFDTTLAKNTEKWLWIPIRVDGNWDMHYTEDLKDLAQYVKDTYKMRICGLASKGQRMIEGDANFAPLRDWLKKWKPSKNEINQAKNHKSNHSLNQYYNLLSGLKGIEDERVEEWLKEYKTCYGVAVMLPLALKSKTLEEKEVKDFVALNTKMEALFKTKYPLLEEVLNVYRNKDEVVFYMNAKYLAKEKK